MDKYSHRKSTAIVTVKDAAGTPMPGCKVQAKLKRHEFLFGCGVFFLSGLLNPIVPAERKELLAIYWDAWKELFNYGTLPFYQGRYEPREGETMQEETLRAAKYLRENGCLVKGHPLCWHTVSAKWLMPKTNEEVLENQLFRIKREVSAFKDYITLWDVINEVVIMPIFDKEENAITRLCQKLGRVEMVKKVFDRAHETDPNATLLLNDFNTSESYRQLIEDCLSAGIPIDVIGIQSHQHQGFWGLEKLHEVLDRFASFGMPMHFTENTFVSGDLMPPHIVDLNDWQVPDWPTTPAGEDRQADNLIAMIDTLFAHPQVEAFTNWDFTDGAWLGAPAGLVRKDGSKKPSYEALKQRIKRDWHTEIAVQTDENGQFTLDGFRGTYEITSGGKSSEIVLNKTNKNLTVTF